METAIVELDRLRTEFLRYRDQAAARKEHFRGVDAVKEAEMRGYALAFTQAAGKIFEVIQKLEKM